MAQSLFHQSWPKLGFGHLVTAEKIRGDFVTPRDKEHLGLEVMGMNVIYFGFLNQNSFEGEHLSPTGASQFPDCEVEVGFLRPWAERYCSSRFSIKRVRD